MSIITITIDTDKIVQDYGDTRDLRSLLHSIDYDILKASDADGGIQSVLHAYFYPDAFAEKY